MSVLPAFASADAAVDHNQVCIQPETNQDARPISDDMIRKRPVEDDVVAFANGSVKGPVLDEQTLSDLQQAPTRRKGGGSSRAWDYVMYEDIPDWMRDNDLIRGYYRPQMTIAHAMGTLFAIHNETFNVWSHLLGKTHRRTVESLPE